MRTVALTKESTKDILENLLKRSPNNYGKFESAVDEILNECERTKATRPFLHTQKNLTRQKLLKKPSRVTEEEIKEAYEAVDPALIDVIRKALVNIRSYHEKQRQNSWFTSRSQGNHAWPESNCHLNVSVFMFLAARQSILLLFL